MLVLAITGLAVGGVLFVAMQKPDEFRVKREMLMKASPEKIFPHLNNLENGQVWSPWVEMEPSATYILNGTEGVGASVQWEGKKVGKGTQTITESIPHERVRSRLDFLKPMKAVNTAEFILTPQGDQTLVTWSMWGPNKFMGKVMSVFMNCEKIVGGQFEKGLGNLKKIVEAA